MGRGTADVILGRACTGLAVGAWGAMKAEFHSAVALHCEADGIGRLVAPSCMYGATKRTGGRAPR